MLWGDKTVERRTCHIYRTFKRKMNYTRLNQDEKVTIWDAMQENLSTMGARRQIMACLLLFIIGYFILLQADLENHNRLFLPHYVPSEVEWGFVVSTTGCQIPSLDPWDQTVAIYASTVEPKVVCDKHNMGDIIISNITALYIDRKAAKRYLDDFLAHNPGTEPVSVRCCYTPFYRITLPQHLPKHPLIVSYQYRYANYCKPISDSVDVSDEEFLKVTCRINDSVVYKDFFAFTPKSLNDKGQLPNPKNNLSVLVIGLDGLSRLNFLRTMPKSYKHLTSRTSSVEMVGYNKVGDNTFPNLIPALLGKTENEIKKTCWPSENMYFDKCDFLWNKYSRAGFITAFAEDASWMGCFEYQKNGFRRQPTDLYYRTFNHVAEKEKGHEKRLNANLCIGNKMNMFALLDIVQKFAITMVDKLSFGFFWENSLTHDYLTLPSYGDDMLKDLLDKLDSSGVTERSILIVMSDHGIRWGGIRETYQGYLEERLPLLIINYPSWFKHQYPLAATNLYKNRKQLTSHFDLHETLLDLLDMTSISNEEISRRTQLIEKELPRGVSLFLRIPGRRTCENAGITDAWCTCHQSQEISVNNTVVIKTAYFLVDYINNNLLKGYPQCSQLTLKYILGSRLHQTKNGSATEHAMSIKDYSIRIQTAPGDAIFEATIRSKEKNKDFGLVGTITRSNLYGNQSSCVSHYKIKMYCYCLSNLKTILGR